MWLLVLGFRYAYAHHLAVDLHRPAAYGADSQRRPFPDLAAEHREHVGVPAGYPGADDGLLAVAYHLFGRAFLVGGEDVRYVEVVLGACHLPPRGVDDGAGLDLAGVMAHELAARQHLPLVPLAVVAVGLGHGRHDPRRGGLVVRLEPYGLAVDVAAVDDERLGALPGDVEGVVGPYRPPCEGGSFKHLPRIDGLGVRNRVGAVAERGRYGAQGLVLERADGHLLGRVDLEAEVQLHVLHGGQRDLLRLADGLLGARVYVAAGEVQGQGRRRLDIAPHRKLPVGPEAEAGGALGYPRAFVVRADVPPGVYKTRGVVAVGEHVVGVLDRQPGAQRQGEQRPVGVEQAVGVLRLLQASPDDVHVERHR